MAYYNVSVDVSDFDTEQEALIALFEQFKEKIKRKVEFFNKESKKLGIKQELRLL